MPLPPTGQAHCSLKVPLMMSGAMPDRNRLKPRRLQGRNEHESWQVVVRRPCKGRELERINGCTSLSLAF